MGGKLAHCLLILCLSQQVWAADNLYPEVRRDLRITSVMLGDALTALAQQTDVQILFPYDLARTRETLPVVGQFTVQEALDILLRGSGFSGSLTERGVITIARKKGDQEEAMLNKTNNLTLFAGVSTFVLSAFTPADSQAQGTPAKVETTLQEVVVTAQKREESLQNTPISIAALGAEALESRGIATALDLSSAVPNVRFSLHPNSSNSLGMFVRGIGDTNNQVTRDSAVATYLDGVYLSRNQGLNTELAELERVEVLRGPQGTLYGRNATAGAVNFITKDPELNTLRFKQRFTFGNYSELRSRSSLNVPIGDQIAVELTYMHAAKDGFVKNRGTGEPYFGSLDRDAARVALIWVPTDRFELRYAYDTTWIHDSSPYIQPIPLMYGFAPRASEGSPLVRNFQPNSTRIQGHTLTLSYDVSDQMTLKSISSFRKMKSREYQDYFTGALGPFTLFTIDDAVKQEQMSQEIQITGDAWRNQLKYVAGLFYYREAGDELNVVAASAAVSPRYAAFGAKSYAAYGQGTYTPDFLDSRVHLTFGLRWTRDERDAGLFSRRILTAGPTTTLIDTSAERSFHNLSTAVTLQYDVTPDVHVYVKRAEGYKAGGFAVTASSATTFSNGYGPEKLVSYELGAKTELLNNRLRLNGAVFYEDYSDIQLNVVDPLTPAVFDVINAGKANIKGLELDATALLFEGFTLNASLGFNKGKYDKVVDLGGNDITNQFQFWTAPRHSLSIAGDYKSRETPVGIVEANVSYDWQGRFNNLVNDQTYAVASVGLVNARLGLTQAFGFQGLSVAVWARNLADKEYYAFTFPAVARGAIYGQPRSFGLDVSLAFGG